MDAATGGRRERRKAQTRTEIRAAAQRLFAERSFDAVTIADIAATADVAVQTVFNHFDSKEALFFDGRTPWVEGVAAAVTARPHGTGPLAALRSYLESDLHQLLEQEAQPEHRSYLEALARTTSLQQRERTLVEEAGGRVAAALATALAATEQPDGASVDLLSRLAADLFLVAGRVLVLANRRQVLGTGHGTAARGPEHATTAATLAVLEDGVRRLARQLDVRID
ncbi:helix-turn-helix domain containing protein [Modestobacter sp. VKM Ac-2977]|uniref:TetR/AcrR family transcriptional regulator n=1 Tax=Modestobacter sp. VKM Ac-2977 TaxID=3004131 RepID=UPI0022AA72BC|nr:TetR/AcrR family transcriptional regulator [Modestobacter sp. VKM Ac-2977]MCZ2822729.1 helix-turn-helix domain containing protein [Modestobacter sp. VKM Ac-2977]